MRKTHRWTVEEIACILNWLDFCLITGRDFKQTILEQLELISKRELDRRKVHDKLIAILRYQCHRTTSNANEILQQGTRCIPIPSMPKSWVNAMRKGRKQLRLPPLGSSFLSHEEKELGASARNAKAIAKGDKIHASVVGRKERQDALELQRKQRKSENSLLIEQSVPVSGQLTDHSQPSPRVLTNREPVTNEPGRHETSQLDGSCTQVERGAYTVKRKLTRSEYSHPKKEQLTSTLNSADSNTRAQSPQVIIRRTQQPQVITVDTFADVFANAPPKSPAISSELSELTEMSTPESLKRTNLINRSDEFRAEVDRLSMTVQKRGREIKSLRTQQSGLWNKLESLKATEGYHQMIKSISRTVQRDPETAYDKLVEDLLAADEAKTRYRRMMADLIGPMSFLDKLSLPVNPLPESINLEWKLVGEAIKTATEIGGGCSPQLPPPYLVKGFGVALDAFLHGHYPERELRLWFLNLAEHATNICVVRGLVGVLLARCVFGWSVPAFDGENSQKVNRIFNFIASIDSLEAVQRLELAVTKDLIEQDEFQNNDIPNTATTMAKYLSEFLTGFFGTPVELSKSVKSSWFEQAIRLKLKLMISSMDYEIQCFAPGVQFDPECMEPENEDGCPLQASACKNRTVSLCLFPAIIQYQAEPLGELPSSGDFSAALVSNKTFFPKPRIKTRASMVPISKAWVLLE
ncbi:hypothetical protein K469DRAFT_337629 [Zopfia rhizophila CBS 207.26]|uniref:Uncharacterized protein n=1 Tax=Zopfia rhizophila CBS 207.26 TaxID=1314779 RepID=A0A6A6DIX3_9PEZI|nr:hypothetical protein K469DRAFT_337629 [Zopfia rhizophila CBS 207.26]